MNQDLSKKITVGISCIGSGVGESVINSCRLSNLPLRTVGLGTNPFAFGAYACDVMDYTPTIYASDFIEKLIQKCIEYQIDFLIPGRDDEAHIYAQNRPKFEQAGIEILAASEEMIALCRDKERMSLELNPIADVFVKCFQKEKILESLQKGETNFPLIAKPRSGFASKGVEIIHSEADFHLVSENHILQELAEPKEDDPNYGFFISEIAKNRNPQVAEISIQLVIGKSGDLLGKMATYNKLSNGIPIEIIPFENPQIWETVDQLLPEFLKRGLVGPLNIQGRLTDKGLKVFEMNPRFTGITGLRALMGFNEVEACIKSWLEIERKPNSLAYNPNRFGIRQTADRVMGLHKNHEVSSLFYKLNKNLFSYKKRLLLTGASGYLGQCLVKDLLKDGNYDLFVLGRSKAKLESLFAKLPVHVVDLLDLEQGRIDIGSMDIIVHGAFARPHQGEQAIAESLAWTTSFFTQAASHQVPLIINISSQSVYGPSSGESWTESSPVAPQGVYGQAKHAAELVLKSLGTVYPQIQTVSLRLTTLAGGQAGLEPIDLLSKMVLFAKQHTFLQLINGQFPLNRLDVRDASKAILKLLKGNSNSFNSIYNIGQTKTSNLTELAKIIVAQTAHRVEIRDQRKPISEVGRLNSDKFHKQFDWRPEFELEDTVQSLLLYFDDHLEYSHEQAGSN